MNATKPRDWTNMIIIGFFLMIIGCVIFGMTMEILKFAALVKWVFS